MGNQVKNQIKKPDFHILAEPVMGIDGKTPITLEVGDCIIFDDAPDELYNIVGENEPGVVGARFCYDDGRHSVEPDRPHARYLIIDPEVIKKAMKSRCQFVKVKLHEMGRDR